MLAVDPAKKTRPPAENVARLKGIRGNAWKEGRKVCAHSGFLVDMFSSNNEQRVVFRIVFRSLVACLDGLSKRESDLEQPGKMADKV